MQFFRAISRSLLAPAVIAILLASMPRARAADEIIRTPAPIDARTEAFILAPADLGLARTAVSQRTFLGICNIALFQVATRQNGFTFNPLIVPLIVAQEDGSAIRAALAAQSEGNVHRNHSPGAHVSSGVKPMLSPGQRRFNPDDGLLTVEPATINFGAVTVGSNENQMGALIASDSEVTVSSATISGPEFTLSGLSFPFTIPAGGHQAYTVGFTPQTAGTASATLTFVTDGNALATQTLTGIGDQPLHTVYLSWNASSSPDVVGYNIYRGTTSGGPYGRINSALDPSTVYTDTSASNGSTYYYVTTAIDGSGQESAYSNEVQAVIP